MKTTLLLLCVVLSPLSGFAKDLVADEIRRIELSAEIAELVASDQALRFGSDLAIKRGVRWEEVIAHPLFQRKLAKIDSQNAAKIKLIVAKNGWPKISEYGKFTARNTWLLVQHMDHDVEFQKEILTQMKELLSKDEVLRPDYALLYDRVQVNTGKLQLYGSQGGCIDKAWQPKPMIDPDDVDKRRKEMELPPMDEYKLMFKESCLFR